MLHSISWEQFTIILSCVVAVYYMVVTLILYRKELTHFIKNGTTLLRDDVSKAGGNHEKAGNTSSSSPMGVAVKEDRTKQSHTAQESSSEMLYAGPDDLPDPIDEVNSVGDRDDEILVGIISDLLEEVKVVCGAITDSAATKEEASVLFEALLSNYKTLKDTPYQASITDHIYSVTREPFIVDFSREEIEAFWYSET